MISKVNYNISDLERNYKLRWLKKNQGVAISLTLPEDDETKINENSGKNAFFLLFLSKTN